jgi:isopentenyl-diphosphate delta-isomerase type 1
MSTKLPNYKRVNLVNEQDEIIASADKLEAHLGEALLHQAISLFLFRKNTRGKFELLIQKRSQQKIVAAGEWGNTVCANVAMGESHEQCLWRRLKDELGVELPKEIKEQAKEIAIINYHVPCNKKYSEREIDHIFALFLDEKQFEQLSIQLNPEEVSKSQWVDWTEMSEKKQFNNLDLAPWLELFLEKPEIVQGINHYLANLSL